MSEDLVSLRMMVIGAAQPDQVLWRQAMALASVMIDLTIHDAATAATVRAKTGADICIVDASLSDANKTAVVASARAAQPAPLIFVSAPKNTTRVEGIDGMLSKPANGGRESWLKFASAPNFPPAC